MDIISMILNRNQNGGSGGSESNVYLLNFADIGGQVNCEILDNAPFVTPVAGEYTLTEEQFDEIADAYRKGKQVVLKMSGVVSSIPMCATMPAVYFSGVDFEFDAGGNVIRERAYRLIFNLADEGGGSAYWVKITDDLKFVLDDYA